MDIGTKIDPTAILANNGTGLGSSKPTKKTAQEFESFLIFSVLKEFQKALGHTKKSYAEETQMSIFYEKVADALATKGIGVKEVVTKYLDRGAKVSENNGENR